MNPEDYLLEEEDKELTPEALMGGALEADPDLLAAREQRDADLANTALFQGITDIGTGLASQGRVSSNNAVFDAIRKNANTKVEDVKDAAKTKSKSMSDFLKAKMAEQRRAESDDWRKKNFDLKEREVKAAELAAGIKRDEAKTKEIDSQVEKLSKQLSDSGLDELDTISSRLDASVKPNDPNYDVPGYGRTYMAPEAILSREGVDARQDVQALKNVILKARSGGSVTPQEAERMLNELGEGALKDDKQLQRGIGNVLSQLRAKAGTIRAGVTPDAVSKFESRGGKVPFAGPPKQKPTPEQIAAELKRRGLR